MPSTIISISFFYISAFINLIQLSEKKRYDVKIWSEIMKTISSLQTTGEPIFQFAFEFYFHWFMRNVLVQAVFYFCPFFWGNKQSGSNQVSLP